MRVEKLLNEVLGSMPKFVEVSHRRDPEYPSGFVGVQGFFDEILGDIEIILVSQYDYEEDFEWDKVGKAKSFYYHELGKTINHEMIHREQAERGESFEDMPRLDASDEEYYSHPLEIEAYGRADMYAEVEDNGYSETLAIYTSLFGKGSKEVMKLIDFCEDERAIFTLIKE